MGEWAELPPALTKLIRGIRLVAFDFDGVFTDNTVYVFEDGREAVRCNRGDGFGLMKLRRLGIATVVVSTEANPVVTARCRKLSIPCVQGVEDKMTALEEIAHGRQVPFDCIAYVGNDINDLPCLRAVGLPIAVHDAHPDVLAVVRYRTRAAGGKGAVREVGDLFDHVLGAGDETER